jgi:hypothetical protein
MSDSNQYKRKRKTVWDDETDELNLDAFLRLMFPSIGNPKELADISGDIQDELFNIASKNGYKGNFVDFITVLNAMLTE